MTVADYLKQCWQEGTHISKSNSWAAAFIGAPAHFGFYFLFHYTFNLPYESFTLRIIATLLCASTISLYKFKGLKYQIYWHAMLIFVLPFIFTTNLLQNNFHDLWLWWEIFMIFVLIIYVQNWLIFIVDLAIGIIGAYIFFHLTNTTPVEFRSNFNLTLYLLVVIFTAIVGLIFTHSNLKTLKEAQEQKVKLLHFLAASITHEMRNPFMAVSLAIKNNYAATQDFIEEIKKNSTNSQNKIDSYLEEITNNSNIATSAIKRADNIIDVMLDEMSNRTIDKSSFVKLSAYDIINKAIKEYGYKSNKERAKVICNAKREHDFTFMGDENLMIYVLFNLIKNALQHNSSKRDLQIEIGINKVEIAGTNNSNPESRLKDYAKSQNSIYITDNGNGIKPNLIPHLFSNFITSSEKTSIGLGLPFCKRVIIAFGGDIKCESKKGEYTKFILYFPLNTLTN